MQQPPRCGSRSPRTVGRREGGWAETGPGSAAQAAVLCAVEKGRRGYYRSSRRLRPSRAPDHAVTWAGQLYSWSTKVGESVRVQKQSIGLYRDSCMYCLVHAPPAHAHAYAHTYPCLPSRPRWRARRTPRSMPCPVVRHLTASHGGATGGQGQGSFSPGTSRAASPIRHGQASATYIP